MITDISRPFSYLKTMASLNELQKANTELKSSLETFYKIEMMKSSIENLGLNISGLQMMSEVIGGDYFSDDLDNFRALSLPSTDPRVMVVLEKLDMFIENRDNILAMEAEQVVNNLKDSYKGIISVSDDMAYNNSLDPIKDLIAENDINLENKDITIYSREELKDHVDTLVSVLENLDIKMSFNYEEENEEGKYEKDIDNLKSAVEHLNEQNILKGIFNDETNILTIERTNFEKASLEQEVVYSKEEYSDMLDEVGRLAEALVFMNDRQDIEITLPSLEDEDGYPDKMALAYSYMNLTSHLLELTQSMIIDQTSGIIQHMRDE